MLPAATELAAAAGSRMEVGACVLCQIKSCSPWQGYFHVLPPSISDMADRLYMAQAAKTVHARLSLDRSCRHLCNPSQCTAGGHSPVISSGAKHSAVRHLAGAGGYLVTKYGAVCGSKLVIAGVSRTCVLSGIFQEIVVSRKGTFTCPVASGIIFAVNADGRGCADANVDQAGYTTYSQALLASMQARVPMRALQTGRAQDHAGFSSNACIIQPGPASDHAGVPAQPCLAAREELRAQGSRPCG